MTMAFDDLKRREFLKAMNLGLCALPLFGERSMAAPNRSPKRLLTVMQTGGTIPEAFFPSGGAGVDLVSYNFPAIVDPLKPFAKDISIVKGLVQRNFLDNFPRADKCGDNVCSHGGAHESYATLFSARRARAEYHGEVRGFMESHAAGPTLDRYVGKKIAAAGGPLPLVLGVVMNKQASSLTQQRCSFDDSKQPQSPQDDTKKLFDTYFANRPSGPDPAMEKLRLTRKSLLDAVGKDLERFSVRAGKAYQYKVDAHLTAVRELEGLLSTPGASATCSKPVIGAFNANDLSQYEKAMEAQLRFIAAALACDVARSICLQTCNSHGDQLVFDWLGISGQGQEFPARNYHDVQHRPGTNNADKIKVDRWFMSQLAFLLKLMSDVKESDGTLLDNSAVLWANHSGIGGAHNSNDLPWILAGKAGGALKSGLFLQGAEVSTTSVLTALCGAMGHAADASFADGEYNKPLTALLS
jgi:Protein of unknown function (DUF1552)